MWVTMNVSLLLLLVFSVCGRPAGAKRQEAVVSPDHHAARLRGLWELHIKEMLKGKGEPAPGKHPSLYIFSNLVSV